MYELVYRRFRGTLGVRGHSHLNENALAENSYDPEVNQQW